MTGDPMTDAYAVFGNPIAHSQSPRIHQAFAAQTGEAINYTRQLVELGEFSKAASAFIAAGARGLNITLPFKLDAYSFADQLSREARQAGAVNTLVVQADGSVLGDNTDGLGLLRDIRDNLGWSITGRRLLLLGAGGAVRGALGPLLAEQPAQLVIANRTATGSASTSSTHPGPGCCRRKIRISTAWSIPGRPPISVTYPRRAPAIRTMTAGPICPHTVPAREDACN